MDEALRLIAIQLIPLFTSLLSPLDSFFIKLFIHNEDTIQNHLHEIKYLITGQSILICPLSSFIVFTSFLFKLNILPGVYTIFLAIYSCLYIYLLGKMIKMSPTEYEFVKQPYRFIYRYLPAILCFLAIICNLVK
jgi:hypothetical protein